MENITNEEQVNEYVDNIVKIDENDPMWGNSARMILKGIMLDFIRKKGSNWTLEDLRNALTVENAKKHFIKDTSDKILQSILINADAAVAKAA